jgi:hypothetical protein
MTDESPSEPPRTIPHKRVMAAMEALHGLLPDSRDKGVPEADDDTD